MYKMFINTTCELLTIAFVKESEVFKCEKTSFNDTSELMLPMIKDLMDKNNITFDDIEEIIAVNGPGSFTGIRIGLSIAKTIAYAKNIPIKVISSLTSYLVSNEVNKEKMAVIEDSKGYYISVFDKDNNVVVSERYVEDINGFNYYVVENKLDILKIVEYSKCLEYVNPHLVTANYVKTIEVEK